MITRFFSLLLFHIILLQTLIIQNLHTKKSSFLNSMHSSETQVNPTKQSPPPAQRKPQKITQLLCLDQNHQLKSIFTTWLSQSFKYLPGCLQTIYLELQLLINFIQYRFTVARDKPQVGDYLQNIKYKDLSRNKKILFLLMDVLWPYLKRRLVNGLESLVEKYNKSRDILRTDHDGGMTAWDHIIKIFKHILKFIAFCDKLYALASFVNLAVFIKQGKYRSITQRVLSIPMQFLNPQNSRVLDFTLMNRNMIWQIYEMVLKNLLPYLYKFLGSGLKNVFYLHSYMGVQDNEQGCGVCGDVPTMAVKAEPCGHLCCFYCSKGAQGQRAACKKCGENVQNWAPLYV